MNKKFEKMLTRRAKACSSSSLQTVLVYLQPFRRSSFLEWALLAKNNKTPLF